MPAIDQCQKQVVRALEKDGWTLEASPAVVYNAFRAVYIDLEVVRGLNGSRETLMLVEVKCFPDPKSTTRDLYTSIGQYQVYRAMLEPSGRRNDLYLTVPKFIFDLKFDPYVMRVVRESQIKMIVIDLDREEIAQWIR